jgi:CDP-diacylglycerol--serine O-phosphatidyltransferase
VEIKRHIPNFITCLNLVCGCLGLVYAFEGNLQEASYLILLACLFDFFDGFVARMVKAGSAIGKELDSLADVVSFGLLPWAILFKLSVIEGNADPISFLYKSGEVYWYSYITLLIPVFSALRLAKFNIDVRQADHFIGVPTPANAILIASFPFIYLKYPIMYNSGLYGHMFPPIIAIVMSLLLVSEIPLIALKFRTFSWQANKFRYVFIVISAILILCLGMVSIPLIILLYIIISLWEWKNSYGQAEIDRPLRQHH